MYLDASLAKLPLKRLPYFFSITNTVNERCYRRITGISKRKRMQYYKVKHFGIRRLHSGATKPNSVVPNRFFLPHPYVD